MHEERSLRRADLRCSVRADLCREAAMSSDHEGWLGSALQCGAHVCVAPPRVERRRLPQRQPYGRQGTQRARLPGLWQRHVDSAHQARRWGRRWTGQRHAAAALPVRVYCRRQVRLQVVCPPRVAVAVVPHSGAAAVIHREKLPQASGRRVRIDSPRRRAARDGVADMREDLLAALAYARVRRHLHGWYQLCITKHCIALSSDFSRV